MFARAQRGFVDFLAAALCVWAAAYYTPAGALVRSAIARLISSVDETRPLLAYYSGGVYDSHDVQVPVPPVIDTTALPSGLLPGSAIGRGVWATVSKLPPSANQRAEVKAVTSPAEAAVIIDRLKRELGVETDDAAVLSLFTSTPVAAYAVQRARAEGRPITLESLALQLPPTSRAAIQAASASLTLGTAYSLGWPVVTSTPVTSPFGYRIHPITGAQQLHSGVDLALAIGTDVRVVADGVVRRASEDDLNGRLVIVDHGHGVATAYCHNTELLVENGAHVKAGQVISRSGNTGRSTGPHLHYQLNLASKPTDPFVFRDQRTVPELPSAAPVGVEPPKPPTQPGRGSSAELKAIFDKVGTKPDIGGTETLP